MKIADTSTPVVILRSFGHGGLCIARSLGTLGVPVYVVDPDRHTPAFASRYCRGGFTLDVENLRSEEALERLEAIANSVGRRSILIPTADEGAIFIAEHAARLRKSFIFPERDPALIHTLCSKQHMHTLARQAGIPTPEVLFPQSIDDVVRFAREISFPVMLKGIDGKRMSKRAGKKMFIVGSAEELLEKYKLAEDPAIPNVMLQEYLPGGDDTVWMFNGYFERGECLFGITGKKIRQSPVYTGSTSLGICLPNDTVDSLTRAFMKSVGYSGVLDIGFRYDARDGKYKVLDVNPRVGSTFRLFVDDHDLDAVRVFYLAMTGQPIIPGTPLHGRKWFVEDVDLVSSYRYRRDGKLSVVDWIKSFRGVREGAYWSASDPRPFFRMLLNDCGELARRIRRRGQTTSRASISQQAMSTYPALVGKPPEQASLCAQRGPACCEGDASGARAQNQRKTTVV